ncbi:MAG: hypothetical protein ACI35S_00690 [Anaeroplasma sp.]
METTSEELISDQDISDYEPQSRNEQFLKDCLTGTQSTIVPETRFESLLQSLNKTIQESGGSSGSANSIFMLGSYMTSTDTISQNGYDALKNGIKNNTINLVDYNGVKLPLFFSDGEEFIFSSTINSTLFADSTVTYTITVKKDLVVETNVSEISIPTKLSELTNDSGFTTHQDISEKQDALVSGTNIKTINGESILGSGDLTIEGESSGSGVQTIYIKNCDSTGAVAASGTLSSDQLSILQNSIIFSSSYASELGGNNPTNLMFNYNIIFSIYAGAVATTLYNFDLSNAQIYFSSWSMTSSKNSITMYKIYSKTQLLKFTINIGTGEWTIAFENLGGSYDVSV